MEPADGHGHGCVGGVLHGMPAAAASRRKKANADLCRGQAPMAGDEVRHARRHRGVAGNLGRPGPPKAGKTV